MSELSTLNGWTKPPVLTGAEQYAAKGASGKQLHTPDLINSRVVPQLPKFNQAIADMVATGSGIVHAILLTDQIGVNGHSATPTATGMDGAANYIAWGIANKLLSSVSGLPYKVFPSILGGMGGSMTTGNTSTLFSTYNPLVTLSSTSHWGVTNASSSFGGGTLVSVVNFAGEITFDLSLAPTTIDDVDALSMLIKTTTTGNTFRAYRKVGAGAFVECTEGQQTTDAAAIGFAILNVTWATPSVAADTQFKITVTNSATDTTAFCSIVPYDTSSPCLCLHQASAAGLNFNKLNDTATPTSISNQLDVLNPSLIMLDMTAEMARLPTYSGYLTGIAGFEAARTAKFPDADVVFLNAHPTDPTGIPEASYIAVSTGFRMVMARGSYVSCNFSAIASTAELATDVLLWNVDESLIAATSKGCQSPEARDDKAAILATAIQTGRFNYV